MERRGVMGEKEAVEWLQRVEAAWKEWEGYAQCLNSILIYLDRRYIPSKDLPSIRHMSLKAFTECVMEDQIVREKCLAAFGIWLDGERSRSSTSIESSAYRGIKSFLDVTLVLSASDSYKAYHISRSQQDYASSSAALAAKISSPSSPEDRPATEFVKWIRSKLIEEEKRCKAIWSGSSTTDQEGSEGAVVGHVQGIWEEVWKEVRKVIEKECIEEHVVEHIQRAVDETIEGKNPQDLKVLYELMTSVRKFTVFKNAFSQHIKTQSTQIVADPAKDATMVASILDFKHQLDEAIRVLYDFDPRTETEIGKVVKEEKRKLALENEVREGLKYGVETRQEKPAELIAKHLDTVMRKGQGALTQAQFEHSLDEIVSLVKFTKDKDVFKEFYMTQLAKRLLLSKSASNEEELSMVKKLKTEYGEEFTTGDAMMKDLSSSDEMNNKYQEFLIKNGKGESNLTVYVLSQGQWPQYKQLQKGWENMTLPPTMQKQLTDFAAWYNHTYSGRVLSWRHQHTTVTLTARFPAGNKEIGVSLFQAMVLMQFNDADSLDFEEIFARTGIERGELIRTLQSLYGVKATRMLVKRPPGKEVAPTDKFTFNSGFTRDRIKFKINQLQQDLSAEETKQTTERVFEDRVLTLDAQIVRIMKSKKTLKLNELVNETVEAVSKMFMPEVKAIKKQIESLIEREYLERDDSDRNLLKYLA